MTEISFGCLSLSLIVVIVARVWSLAKAYNVQNSLMWQHVTKYGLHIILRVQIIHVFTRIDTTPNQQKYI